MTLTSDIRALIQAPSVSSDDIDALIPHAKTRFSAETGATYSDCDTHNLAVMYLVGSMIFPERGDYLAGYESVAGKIIADSESAEYTGRIAKWTEGDTSW